MLAVCKEADAYVEACSEDPCNPCNGKLPGLYICPWIFQGELMNGVKPWRQMQHSEAPHNDAASTLQGLASQRLATADHLPSSIEMSMD